MTTDGVDSARVVENQVMSDVRCQILMLDVAVFLTPHEIGEVAAISNIKIVHLTSPITPHPRPRNTTSHDFPTDKRHLSTPFPYTLPMTSTGNMYYLLLALLLPLQQLTANHEVVRDYTLSGKVLDSQTGAPLPFAAIQIRGQNIYVQTDFDGNYRVSVAKGEHALLVNYASYQQSEQRIVVKQDQHHNVRMYRLVNRYESRTWFVEETETAIRDRYVVGTVSDGTTGGRLIGATVTVKGTKLGTITDFDGTFQLHVPAGEHTIEFSYVGYTVAGSEVNFTEDKRLDVKLYANSAAEVLVSPPADLNWETEPSTPVGDGQRDSSLPFFDDDTLILVDGKKVSKTSLGNLDPTTIKSIDVVKQADQIEALEHGSDYSGAILITLNK